MTRISPKIMNVEGNRIEYISIEDELSSMSNISPKIIDVEGNRIGIDLIKCGNAYFGNTEGRYNWNNGTIKEHIGNKYIGRFPTQLYTNIKNERFKYVKNI